jgi:hypothetical protein
MVGFIFGVAFLACCLAAAINDQAGRARWSWTCFAGAMISIYGAIVA